MRKERMSHPLVIDWSLMRGSLADMLNQVLVKCSEHFKEMRTEIFGSEIPDASAISML